MSEMMTLRDFFRYYFLTFIVGVLAAYVSLALATALAFVTYFSDEPIAEGYGKAIMLTGAALTLITVHSNFMILRGRPSWTWVMASVYFTCFLFVLPMIQYKPHNVIYALALMFPLFGLLTINSKVQREMRNKLVEIRYCRESAASAIDRRKGP